MENILWTIGISVWCGIGILVWCGIGLWGFIYWWTSDYDLLVSSLIFGILVSIMGIFSWILGWMIHGDSKKLKLIIMKKKRVYEEEDDMNKNDGEGFM